MAADLAIIAKLVDQASGPLASLQGAAAKAAHGIVEVGKAAAIAAGAATVAAGGVAIAATKMAGNFQAGMLEVASLFDPSEAQLKTLSDGVLDLSKRLGTDAVESTKALYQAISAGVPAENALSFLEVASKAAIGGVTTTETAVNGLTTVINAFKAQGVTAEEAADVLFTTVRLGKTTFAELSASMFNVAPLAAAAGVKFQEVSAAIATLTLQGTPTSVATTQIRAAIQAVMKPSDDLTAIFQKAGFASGELALKQIGLQKSLNIVNKATGGSTSKLTELFGSIEAVQAALGITGDQAEVFESALKGMENAAGAANKAFETMQKGLNQQMKVLEANIKGAMIELGSAIIPLVTPIIMAFTAAIPGAIERLKTFASDLGGISDAFAESGFAGAIEQLGVALGNLLGVDASDFFRELGQVAQGVGDLFQSRVVPAAQAVANVMAGTLSAALKWLTGTGWPSLKSAVQSTANVLFATEQFFLRNRDAQVILAAILGSLASLYAVLTVRAIAYGVATQTVTTWTLAFHAAQVALNSALGASPFTKVAGGLGLIAGAFAAAYATSEDFRAAVHRLGADIVNKLADAVQAVAGFGDAWDNLNRLLGKSVIWGLGDTLRMQAAEIRNANTAFVAATAGVREYTEHNRRMGEALDAVDRDFQGVSASVEDTAEAVETVATAAATAARAVGPSALGGAIADTGEKTKAATGAFDELARSIAKGIGLILQRGDLRGLDSVRDAIENIVKIARDQMGSAAWSAEVFAKALEKIIRSGDTSVGVLDRLKRAMDDYAIAAGTAAIQGEKVVKLQKELAVAQLFAKPEQLEFSKQMNVLDQQRITLQIAMLPLIRAREEAERNLVAARDRLAAAQKTRGDADNELADRAITAAQAQVDAAEKALEPQEAQMRLIQEQIEALRLQEAQYRAVQEAQQITAEQAINYEQRLQAVFEAQAERARQVAEAGGMLPDPKVFEDATEAMQLWEREISDITAVLPRMASNIRTAEHEITNYTDALRDLNPDSLNAQAAAWDLVQQWAREAQAAAEDYFNQVAGAGASPQRATALGALGQEQANWHDTASYWRGLESGRGGGRRVYGPATSGRGGPHMAQPATTSVHGGEIIVRISVDEIRRALDKRQEIRLRMRG